MTGWAVLTVYVAGYLWCTRWIALREIEEMAATELADREGWRKKFREPHRDEGKPLVQSGDRVVQLMFAMLVSLFWPVVGAMVLVAGRLRAPTEVRADQRAELEALRALAREHNLPMPGER